ncbi:hypothetical protein, variant [Puccinia triticina 1-1 BBBD Race 1]|uniref:Spc7 domain-containing protein n=1 Tax=Puccinia triticina (isolate 1-1 / race 1 (BBBD)) TaxID=630390 RepID=A0A180GZ33_PUCT1|nr:hypothetical protein PTTG_01067 [Puccinia triticina 1-1 BBBD Race 1]OAV97785.1 hypothetical protein, variant [Puccinia triticina 1-1 BBBD Race 1]WAR59301.1 hypothetical protein PtB15_10B643 [Puccinia triticina]
MHRQPSPATHQHCTATMSSNQPPRKPRQSIPTSTLLLLAGSSASGSKAPTPAPTSKPALKKRSKSLGGLALEQKILRDSNNRDHDSLNVDLDLTPRKRARRSLVPGKSILKSRPTISGTGLERTTSDNTLTLNSHTQPLSSLAASAGCELSSSQLTNESSNPPLSQSIRASQDTENQNPTEHHEADNSSDMDLSDDQGLLHRSSLGSNTTTTLLRRVSFAAKAHVRTFGSPLVDPDSSMASSSASAPPNDPPGHPTSSAAQTNASEDDSSTADMSMDSAASNNPLDPLQPQTTAQEAHPNPPENHPPPPSKDALIQAKASRLSMAIPGFGSYDDNDDDDDDGDEEQGQETHKDPSAAKTTPANSHPASLDTAANHRCSQEDPEQSQDMDITTPLQPVPTKNIHPQQSSSSGATQLPKPPMQSGIPRLQSSSSTADQQRRAYKSSRLSVALPEHLRGHRSDETENLDDIPSARPLAQPAGSAPVANSQPTSTDQERRAWKTSRLSVTLPEHLRGNMADDTEDIPATKPPSQSALQSSDVNLPQPDKTHQPKQPKKLKASKASRLTTFLGTSQEDEVANNDDTHHQAQPNEQETNPESDKDRAPSPPSKTSKKPSRLTQLFSDWGDVSRELDNARDQEDPGPSMYSEDSEPAPKKARSRISEFLQPQDSSDMEEADPALIDFHEPATSRPSFGPPPNRSSLSVPSLQNIQEHDDLINMSFEENPAPKPALVLPGPSNSGPSLLSTSSESISRAGSFPRTSLEPVLPRLSSIRALPRLSSASPSRRLSGSLSGSPKNLRLSFASPRRLVFPAGTANHANQNDSAQKTDELLRSKSADPSASVKDAPLDLRRPSNPSHQQHDPHPSGASSSMPPPQILPVPPSPLLISLNEFFEQAEIRFISLSQPRVRNYDQQEHPNLSEGQHRVSSFAQQIFAGMVKIPRLRLLESSSRSLRQKTELLDYTTKEHEGEISRNAQKYKLLKDWVELRQKQTQTGQSHPQTAQKNLEDLNQMMGQLRLKKNLVEMSAKQDCHLFDIEMWKTYQANLHQRTAKLSHDLEVMRKIDSVVKPSTESLRERKQNLIEEIRRRKQKLAEIESCDQNQLKALNEEAKDLAAETEANRRALTESEFERNLWLAKFAELEQEKNEHLQRIEQLKRDPDQSQECTVPELLRLKNEFLAIQKMLGWELVRFEDDLFVFIFYSTIGVNLHLDPFDPEQPYRNVRKVELRWAGPSVPIAEQDEPLIRQVEQFFFGHLKAHFDGKKVQGRVRELVQQISSMWYHAHQLIWEITNAQTRFSVAVDILEPSPAKHRARVSAAPTPGSLTMDVRVSIRSPRNCAAAHCHFLFDGQEILDWLAPAPLAHVSCKVTPVFGKADCLNLSYVLSEHIDKGLRGALKDGCLEALACLDA